MRIGYETVYRVQKRHTGQREWPKFDAVGHKRENASGWKTLSNAKKLAETKWVVKVDRYGQKRENTKMRKREVASLVEGSEAVGSKSRPSDCVALSTRRARTSVRAKEDGQIWLVCFESSKLDLD
jgi:hypothetical protein